MKNETAMNFIVYPADVRLAHLTEYWEAYSTLEAAEDRVDELFDRGLFYDIRWERA